MLIWGHLQCDLLGARGSRCMLQGDNDDDDDDNDDCIGAGLQLCAFWQLVLQRAGDRCGGQHGVRSL